MRNCSIFVGDVRLILYDKNVSSDLSAIIFIEIVHRRIIVHNSQIIVHFTVMPVSYTHLDVYKRQHLCR